jgi:copper homeostasis protein
MVMIRPRGGNYLYSAPEMETMLLDIRTCRDAGADGIVTGVLTPDSTIDMRALSQLVHSAGNLQITFHKAIDACREITQEIGLLRDSGIHRVLSSGGKQTALEGVDMLNDMIRLAAGKLIILAAGMITAENLTELSMLIHTDEFHGRKIAGDLAQCL